MTGTGMNTLVLGSGAGTCQATMTFGLFTPPGEATDLGYTVLHELRKNEASGGWERVAGPQEGLNPAFSIDLLDQEGKSLGAAGFYRIVKLLVPNHDLSITNEIPATNIIGVLEVNSSCTNTMTAVPWSALAHDPAVVSNIVVRDYMKPAQLAAGDTL